VNLTFSEAFGCSRGYGDSSLPEPGPNNIDFSFREMARDLVEVMEQLGYQRFMVAGHDRGGRTTHRLCLDQPERMIKACIMDVVPNYHVWTNITKSWVIGTWHWGFMAQPEPFPERLISAVPAEYFLKNRMAIRGGTGIGFLTDTAIIEYVRCYTLKTITGSCRDYRATATCDFEMDTADKDKKIDMPLFLLWGARGQTPERANPATRPVAGLAYVRLKEHPTRKRLSAVGDLSVDYSAARSENGLGCCAAATCLA
jgi:haloacetate dehalogenase